MEKLKEKNITLPEEFSVGYAAADISGTPETDPITYHAGTCTGVNDPLMLTCIAFCDGKNIALVMTADLKKMFEPIARESLALIEENFGIPKENVIISCTHSHSAPDAGGPDPNTGGRGIGYEKWNAQYKSQLLVAVEEALRDLDPVVEAFTGKADKPGIGFVRRYLLADGTWKFNPTKADNPVEHESVADPEMRSMRFVRKNKKDVFLINFQTHYYSNDRKYPGKFSADYIWPFRESAEAKWDCKFAFFYGASGNVNQLAMLPTDKKVPNADEAFMDGARMCRENEEKVPLGELKIQHSEYLATCKVRSEDELARSREVARITRERGANGYPADVLKEYGFTSPHEVSFNFYYKDLKPTQYAPFTAIAFGDLAFASAPYEMFHENGKQVRDGSPYKTTFICTLAHASNGYVPSAIGYEHGGYETWNCRFVAGSGELFANEMIRLLNECKK